MSSPQQNTPGNGAEPGTDFDAVVVGAGFSGLYMLHRLRDTLGLSARVFEAADDVGGTWYWNRYPGARCDSESYFYSFSDRLSEDLLQEWTWSERFAAQPEILSYLQHVADRFDLRKDIRFNTRVVAADYDEATNRWMVSTDDGGQVTATFLITAVGCLSTTNLPDFPGRDSFRGESYHTGRLAARGRRLHRQAGRRHRHRGDRRCRPSRRSPSRRPHVYVLQRTPNYDIAGRNRPMDAEDGRKIKANYQEIWQTTRETGFGFPYDVADRTALSVLGRGAAADLRRGLGARRLPARHDVQRPAHRRGGQRDGRGVRPRPDPRAGARPGDRRAARAAGPPVLHQAPAAGERLLRDVQPGQRDPGRRAEGADRGDHPDRGADRRTRSTRWTSSSSPPASTR